MRNPNHYRHNNDIKTVAKNGQISLGKEFAGKKIQIIKNTNNTITIIPVLVIPENEMWLYAGDNLQRLDKSIEWVESNSRKDNFNEIIARFENGKD
jgi:hypothetical protein